MFLDIAQIGNQILRCNQIQFIQRTGFYLRSKVPRIMLHIRDKLLIDIACAFFDQVIYRFVMHQRQRVGIARALAVNPDFVVCDEPISALDVSIQAQVVNMLEDLQASLGLTYLFIAHDLSMVRHISQKVGVMYLGSLVEFAETEELYEQTLHPYTKALMSAVPELDPAISKTKKPVMLQGDVPSTIDTPVGCKFASRCPYATKRCHEERPIFRNVGNEHYVACHLVE